MKNSLNKEALIFASTINLWIPSFYFTFRINTILVLGDCKTEEMDCFNKLGLASHPNTTKNMKKKASLDFDKVVNEWKDGIVVHWRKVRLLEDVLKKHSEATNKSEDDMEVCTIDFSVETVTNCVNFSEPMYKLCKEMLPQSVIRDLFEDTDMVSPL